MKVSVFAGSTEKVFNSVFATSQFLGGIADRHKLEVECTQSIVKASESHPATSFYASDKEEYEFMGKMFRNKKTKRVATKAMSEELNGLLHSSFTPEFEDVVHITNGKRFYNIVNSGNYVPKKTMAENERTYVALSILASSKEPFVKKAVASE